MKRMKPPKDRYVMQAVIAFAVIAALAVLFAVAGLVMAWLFSERRFPGGI